MTKNLEKKMQELTERAQIEGMESNMNRARSLTVGTAFGGTTEVMMRSDGGKHLWCVMQPSEVVELIHQLSANIGCHLSLKPREDFASWRNWKISDDEKKHLQGHVPFVNDMAPFNQLGISGIEKSEYEKLLNHAVETGGGGHGATQVKIESQEHLNEIMATEEAKLKRKPKRTPTSS